MSILAAMNNPDMFEGLVLLAPGIKTNPVKVTKPKVCIHKIKRIHWIDILVVVVDI